jgi:uncharacterized membrane protein
MSDTSVYRHVLKTFSYRLIASITTVITAWSMGLSLEMSSLLGISEIMIKPTIYFFHERIWFKYIRIKDK